MASYKDNIQVSVYMDADLDAELQKRADMTDMSKSAYIRDVLLDHVEGDLITETSREVDAEQRIEELVTEATEEITDTTDTALEEIRAHHELMQLVLLRTGMYSAGNWNVLKKEYGEIEVKQAMQSASQRFRDDAAEMGIDINAIGTDRPLRRHTGERSSASTNENEEEADDDDG